MLNDTAMKVRPSLRCVERMWRVAPIASWARTFAAVRDWSRWQPAAKNTSRILEGLTLLRGFVEPDRPRLFGLCPLCPARRHGATSARRLVGRRSRGVALPWRDEQRGEHGLEAMDERVGFLVALKQRLYLVVFHEYFAAHKFIFLF